MNRNLIISLLACVSAVSLIGASSGSPAEPVAHGYEPIVVGPTTGGTGVGHGTGNTGQGTGGHNTGGHNTGGTGHSGGSAPMPFAYSINLGVGTHGPVGNGKYAHVVFRIYEEKRVGNQTILEEIPVGDDRIVWWGNTPRPHQQHQYIKPTDNGKGPPGSAAGIVSKITFDGSMNGKWVVFQAVLQRTGLSNAELADYKGWVSSYRWKVK